jgi:hypothetical protein
MERDGEMKRVMERERERERDGANDGNKYQKRMLTKR